MRPFSAAPKVIGMCNAVPLGVRNYATAGDFLLTPIAIPAIDGLPGAGAQRHGPPRGLRPRPRDAQSAAMNERPGELTWTSRSWARSRAGAATASTGEPRSAVAGSATVVAAITVEVSPMISAHMGLPAIHARLGRWTLR